MLASKASNSNPIPASKASRSREDPPHHRIFRKQGTRTAGDNRCGFWLAVPNTPHPPTEQNRESATTATPHRYNKTRFVLRETMPTSVDGSRYAHRDGACVWSERDAVTENEIRCKDMLECKRQIEFWNEKLRVLEREHTTKIKLARLRLDAVATWRCLSKKDRRDKTLVLAAMESEELPTVLDDFPSGNLPPCLRWDKDILLARIARDDFRDKYSGEERFFVPRQLRGDKEVMLALLPKHPSAIECASDDLRDDPEIFRAVLEAGQELPPYVLQHFSERIRSDRNLVLRLCAHPNGITSLGFAASELRNDKLFFLEAIRVSHGGTGEGREASQNLVLRYASQRLQDDPEVVLEAVRKCGPNLKHASYHLRRDFAVVSAAIEETGAAFRYCLPGEARDRLLSDRELVLRRILGPSAHKHVRESPAHSGTVRACLERYGTDREILEKALLHGIEWSWLPPALRSSDGFVLDAIARTPSIYYALPGQMRSRPEFARAVLRSEDVDAALFEYVAEECPLWNDREAMVAFARSGCKGVLDKTLRFASPEILGNKEIMLEAIATDPVAYEYCTEELSADRDIAAAAVRSSPACLGCLPDAVQLGHPEIVVSAIESFDPSEPHLCYESVCSELWSDRSIALAWIQRFSDWIDDHFLDEFKADEEICLAVAEHNWKQFCVASVSLRSNKEFMLRAVERDARVIRYAENSEDDDSDDSDNDEHHFGEEEQQRLRHDDDLALLAFSRDKRAIQSYTGGEDFGYVVAFTERIRKKLRAWDTYRDVFLEGVLQTGVESENENENGTGPSCPLTLLNQGPHTVEHHSRLIASFVGLPSGEEVAMLRRASANLVHWGF